VKCNCARQKYLVIVEHKKPGVKKMTFTHNQANADAQLNKPVLKEGSKGEAVEELQLLLQKYCAYSGAVDGIFGSATTGAGKLFQYRVFLTQDGIVGDKTWRSRIHWCAG
jgi:peptidoglycan hydrolase-like protein with peptidoglycan-binding domain